MTIYNVDIYEPPGWTADSTVVTADSVVYTADGGPLIGATDSNYAAVNANVLFAEIVEPVGRGWTADSIAVTADALEPTADGAPLIAAIDTLDAAVVAAEAPVAGGGYYRPFRPYLVMGTGYGVLPALEGEGYGVVGAPPATADEGDDEELELLVLMLLAA